MPGNTYRPTHTGLIRLAASFVGQEDVGVLGSLLLRLARYLGGDPSLYVLVTSTGTANSVGLPDNTPAQSATLHVTGNPICYRTDGSPAIAGTDAQLPTGTIITLTGTPTLKGFQFCSAVAGNASLVGEYFD